MGKVYGLLVGINDYPASVGSLGGCVNDVEAFAEYLAQEFAAGDLALEMLENQDATRENVIGGFRSHLGKAGKDDVALFLYCGHGARWASANEFHRFYPEKMDEGLVCIDSRAPGGFDLADKEIAVLLSEVAHNEPHLAVIFDCCHSGSGTRGVPDALVRRARQTHTRHDERPLESYLDGHFAKRVTAGEELFLPPSRHLLMAACERFQQSYEDFDLDKGESHGIFSMVLLELLQGAGRGLSYQELFNRCRREVHEQDSRMLPQFESFGGFDSTVGFLGLEATGSGRQFRVFLDGGSWKLEAGSLDGMPTEPGRRAELTLYPQSGERVAAGGATTRSVGPRTSSLDLDFEPWEDETAFVGEVTSLPLPGLRVLVTGEAAGLAALDEALAGNPQVELTEDPGGVDYEIRSREDRLEFWDLVNARLVHGVRGADEKAAVHLLTETVAHVAAWERAVALQNRGTRMPMDEVEFWLTHGDDVRTLESSGQSGPFEPDRITIDIPAPAANGQAANVPYKLWARNRSAQELHFALFYCSPEYGIEPQTNRPLPPGEEAVELCETAHAMYLKEEVSQEILTLKLIVSTEKFDEGSLEIKPLRRDRGSVVMGVPEPEREIFTEEWFAKSIEVKLVHEGTVADGQDVRLAEGAVIVRAHRSVTAKASLTAAASGSRAAGREAAFIELLTGLGPEARSFELVELGGGRSRGEGSANVLELTDITNAEALQEAPLEIVLDTPLENGEYVLPLVFDGRHILLGGAPSALDDGKTLVRVDHLHEIPSDRRSLAKALKLYFVKTFLGRGGVNKLSWVEYAADGSATRHEEGVRERVEAADRVLVVVHGIIGDTQRAAEGVRRAGVDANFDVVLTYDYENLSTPIEETAADFAAQLAAVGLTHGDGKQLTILAHSMGGLVSRVFIEKAGGEAVVDHLVMCGTPNGGSPFGKLDSARRLATTLTTLLLNYVPSSAPLSVPLLFLLNRSEKITPTLEQMNPGSAFLAELNQGRPETETRYTVLAGNVGDYEAESDQWLSALLTKAAQGSALESLFGTAEHDIATSVKSMRTVEGVDEEEGQVVPCLHTNYFSAPGGLAALAKVGW